MEVNAPVQELLYSKKRSEGVRNLLLVMHGIFILLRPVMTVLTWGPISHGPNSATEAEAD